MGNQSTVTEFILLGIPVPHSLLSLFFWVLLATYLLTLMGNMVIIMLVWTDHHLHTPMYYFLFNLSILEICFTTSIVPVMLVNLLSQSKAISFSGCITQCFLYFFLGLAEFFLLAVMSFDCYMAICNPLCYAVIMNGRVCIQLVIVTWLGSFLLVIGPIIILLKLSYCQSNVINHFFCDIEPLLRLSCSDTRFMKISNFISAVVVLLGSLSVTSVSYIYIIFTVWRIPSASGRQKAFLLAAPTLLWPPYTIFMYLRTSHTSLDIKKSVSVLTTVITPLLNPFIYTLRNEKVKDALRKAFIHNKLSSRGLTIHNMILVQKSKEDIVR